MQVLPHLVSRRLSDLGWLLRAGGRGWPWGVIVPGDLVLGRGLRALSQLLPLRMLLLQLVHPARQALALMHTPGPRAWPAGAQPKLVQQVLL